MSQRSNPRRNTRQQDPSRATNSPKTVPESNPLYSWASVEEHLAAHDGEEIQDYADDIDNLLVFAGLFSAILTAFITQTYPSLVPGDMATTNQLLALSIQAHLHAIGAIPETLDPVLISHASASSADFSPSAADRWINIVFFLSLLFSLAAALFGILAKQWLREYMKWNKPLASPRENVLVRQIRFEAWESWRVAAVISSIPILLELGMFLFLAGVVILLWTLDNVVAQVVTVFAAIFTSIICAFTVLPIFSKRCPYRSPTAWAFLAAARAIYAAFDFGYWFFVLSFTFLLETVLYLIVFIVGLGHTPLEFELCQDVWHDHLSRPNWTAPSTWRDQDLERCFATTVRLGMWSKPIDLHKAARDELVKEKKRFPRDRDGARSPDEDTSLSTLDSAADALLHNIASASRLLRALSWVRQSAENDLISTYVDQCIASIHSSSLQSTGESLAEWDDQIRMLTDWCLLTSVKDNHRPDQPYRALLGATKVSEGKGDELAELRRHSGVHVDDEGHLTLLCDRPHLAKTGLSKSFSLLIPSITQLSKADIKHFSAVATRRNGTSEFRAARQRALELFSSLTVSSNILDDEHVWSLLLEATGHRDSDNPPVVTEISPDLFMLAVRYGKVGLAPNGEGLVLGAEGIMGPPEYEALLVYFTNKFDGLNENYLNLMVLTSFYWLRSGGVSSSGFSAKHILDKMIFTANTISSRTRPRTSLDRRDHLWISELCFRSYALTVFHGSRFRELLHSLGDAFRRDQLVGPQDKIHTHLHDALIVAHKERPCEHVTYCPWQKHNCQRIWGTCPLLSKRRGSTFTTSSPYLSTFAGDPSRPRGLTESSGASSPLPARPRSAYLPPLARVFTRKVRRGTLAESPVNDAGRPSLDTQYSSPSEASHIDLHNIRPRASSTVRFLDVVSSVVGHASGQARSGASGHVQECSDKTAVQEEGGAGEPKLDEQELATLDSTPTSPPVDISGLTATPLPLPPPALAAAERVDTPAPTAGSTLPRDPPPPPLGIYQPPRRSFRDIAARGMRASGSGVRTSGSGVRYAASLFEDSEGERDDVHSDRSAEIDTGQDAGGERTQQQKESDAEA